MAALKGAFLNFGAGTSGSAAEYCRLPVQSGAGVAHAGDSADVLNRALILGRQVRNSSRALQRKA